MSANRFVQLFEKNAHYRRWFRIWWDADFSVGGRKSGHKSNGHIPKARFAEREWVPGWAPPHDLHGIKNPNFRELSALDANQYYWRMINSELSGAFIASGSYEILTQSTTNLAHCAFSQRLKTEAARRSSDFRNSIFVEGLELGIAGHSEKVGLNGAIVLLDADISLPNLSTLDIDKVFIGGDLVVKGESLTISGAMARVKGDCKLYGTVRAPRLRSRHVTISQNTGRTGARPNVNLAGCRAINIKINGDFDKVDLSAAKLDKLLVDANVRELNATQATLNSASLKGNVKHADLSSIKISERISIFDADGEALTLSDASIGESLTVFNVQYNELFADRMVVSGRSTFDKSRFLTGFWCRESIFSAAAAFSRCAFPGKLIVSSSVFERGASFRTGSGSDIASESMHSQVGEADFHGTTFGAGEQEICADFDSRTFLEAANFELATFVGVPMFFGCKFHENTTFRGANFRMLPADPAYAVSVRNLEWGSAIRSILRAYQTPLNIEFSIIYSAARTLRLPLKERRTEQNRRLSNYERAYNALRQRFESVGNAKEERRFHTYELRARRQRIDVNAPLLEGLISRVYDAVSEYGQSISRPLIYLLLAWVLFAALYFGMAGVGEFDGLLESAVFSARQIVKPFSAWSRDFTLPAAYYPESSVAVMSSWTASLLSEEGVPSLAKTTIVRILASVQSLISLLLMFLTGLAVRRTFGLS